MKDTDKNASRGMLTFLAVILAIALAAALIYFVFFHPGAPRTPSAAWNDAPQMVALAILAPYPTVI